MTEIKGTEGLKSKLDTLTKDSQELKDLLAKKEPAWSEPDKMARIHRLRKIVCMLLLNTFYSYVVGKKEGLKNYVDYAFLRKKPERKKSYQCMSFHFP